MSIKAISIMGVIASLLVFAISWGRSTTDFSHIHTQTGSPVWSSNMQLLSRAWAGPVPALAADAAILSVFDIYDQIQSSSPQDQEKLWHQLSFQLHKAQSMDPYFRDVYHLSEGLLAYEGNRITDTIDLLSKSDPWMNSADPLIAASSLAHFDLNNDKLAISLANKAITKPDAQDLTIGFATSLVRQNSGCNEAIAFLYSRLTSLPERYRQGIVNRIRRYKETNICSDDHDLIHAH